MAVAQADLDAVNAECVSTINAFLTGNLDAIEKQFTEDCVVIPPGSPPLKGLPGVKIQLERFANQDPHVKDIKEKIGDICAMGQYIFRRSEFIAINKDNKVIDTLNVAQIWRKDNGKWQRMFEIINSQTPPKPLESTV